MKCNICEIGCNIIEGGKGGCGMYTVSGDRIRELYPERFLAAVDTSIEGMPMVHYHPGGKFLQVCTVGCNFSCHGCVSEMLTDHLSSVEGSTLEMTTEEVISRAVEEECMGIMFCFNEPTVSYFSFLGLARMARDRGLLFGCSTNGYMTRSSLNGIIPFLDFVNVGLKGASDRAYRACGVNSASPVWRNIKALYEHGVYMEISIVFRKGGEREVLGAAEIIASLSPEIPLQVMRFIPFGDATMDLEPSIREAEDLCGRLQRMLNYVYLFNSPGTDLLNSRCPECGAKILERGFFGPMSANMTRCRPEARCECGFQLPVQGGVHRVRTRERGYFGGYRTVNALNMIRALLAILGVKERTETDAVIAHVVNKDIIKGLYEKINRIDAYFETLEYFAFMTDRMHRAHAYRDYVEPMVADIRNRVRGLEKRPVYCTLGHPLLAVFEERMEARLVETAGGLLTTRLIKKDDRPGIAMSEEQFCRMAPDIIIISAAAAWPIEDFIAYCTDRGLDAPAIKMQRVFHVHPYRTSTNPDWILGLLCLCNIIHPDVFSFDLQGEADAFYREFYGMPFGQGHHRAFPGLHSTEPPEQGIAVGF